jgi:Flp pilus assembly protein TadG
MMRPDLIARRAGRYAESASGAAAVEFAIWLLVLVPTFLSVIDLGRYAYLRMEVSNAAQTAVQAAWSNCASAPTSACGTFNTALSTAITNASDLGDGVTEQTAQRLEGYYCADASTGALVSNGANTTCPSGAKAGYYFRLQVSYTYAPVFAAISMGSVLTTPIVQTAWTRLK